jgi:hypothetical protein
VASGVTLTLEAIARDYRTYAARNETPFLPDHGVPEHNVFHRVAGEDFATFHHQVCEAAEIARRALDAKTRRESAQAWRELFGEKFPEPPPDEDHGDENGPRTGGFSPRKQVSTIGGGRFAR